MDISQLTKLRPAGKLEEMAAVAHALDLYTTAGFSVHYKPSQNARPVGDVEPLIYNALGRVLRELPTLFAVPIVVEGAETYFARLPSIDLRAVTTFVHRQKRVPDDGKGSDPELDALLQQQVNTNFKSDQGILPVWRLIILYDFEDNKQFTANLMAHHAIADGASFQILHRTFQKALHQLSSSPQPDKESRVEYVISSKNGDGIGFALESFHSLPIKQEEAPPSDPPKEYNDWKGNPTEVPSKTGFVTLTLPAAAAQAFTKECQKNRIPAPAGLNALITKMVFANLPPDTESMDINIPCDIRGDLPPQKVDGVMGNFFDAFRTRILRSDYPVQEGSVPEALGPFWDAARKVQRDTRSYFGRDTAPSGESYLNIAGLKGIPDLQALLKSMIGKPRSESLELAFIGPHVPYESSGLTWQAGKATVSRCAFALGACLQITAVLHAEGMTVGFAWPRHAVDEGVVKKVVEGVGEYFFSLVDVAA